MRPQSRLFDQSFVPADVHGKICCPHPCIGPAIIGSPNVYVNNRNALRVNDQGVHAACCGPNTWVAVLGSNTVLINNLPAHRLFDMDMHCGGPGFMVEGSMNVLVGDAGSAGAGIQVEPLKLPKAAPEAPAAPQAPPPGAAPEFAGGRTATAAEQRMTAQAAPETDREWEKALKQPPVFRIGVADRAEAKAPALGAAAAPGLAVGPALGKAKESGSWWKSFAGFVGGIFEGLWDGLSSLGSALLSPVTWAIVAGVAALVIGGVVSLATAAAVATVVGAVLLAVGIVAGLISMFAPGLTAEERGRRFGKVLFDVLLIPLGAGAARLLGGFKPLARLGRLLKGAGAKLMNKLKSAGRWAKGSWQKLKGVFKKPARPTPAVKPEVKPQPQVSPPAKHKKGPGKQKQQPKAAAPQGPPRPCLRSGTLVETAAGPALIEELAEGDLVWAKEPGGDGPGEPHRVLWASRGQTRELVRIVAGGGVIEATGGHLFAVVAEGWRAARELKPGDRLELVDGGAVTVEEAALVWLGAPCATYDLTVDTVAAYGVSVPAGVILVHNTDLGFWNQTIYWLLTPNPELRMTDVDGKSFWRTDSLEGVLELSKQRLEKGQLGNHGYYTKEQFEAMLAKENLRAIHTPGDQVPGATESKMRHFSVRQPDSLPPNYVDGTKPPDLTPEQMADLKPKVAKMEPSGKTKFDAKVCG